MLTRLKEYQYQGHGFDFPAKTVPLYAMVAGCGYQRETTHDYRWPGQQRGRREFALWQYTISGKGMVEYEGKLYPVLPGSAVLLHVPHDHCYFLPEDSDQWEFIYINLNGREALRLWLEIERRIGPVGEFGDDSATVAQGVEIFERMIAGEIRTPFQASSLGYQFLMKVADDLLPKAKGGGHIPEFVQQVIDYCLEHLGEPLTVDDLADVAGYSRYHFSRLFTASQGTSPAAFLRELRLRRAVRLLQTEMITIKEIAVRCGFDNSNYFCKVFRKAFGTSPEAYRQAEK